MSGPTNLPSMAINLESHIFLIRGQRVMLDVDLAELYGVSTKALNQAVKRNPRRFPLSFAFRLTPEEKRELVTNCDHLSRLRFSAIPPMAFTEHGAIMIATVLHSERAEEMSVFVVQVFIKLREVLTTHRQLAAKLLELEKKVGSHDMALKAVIDAIRQLTAPPPTPKRKIGFMGTQKKLGAKP